MLFEKINEFYQNTFVYQIAKQSVFGPAVVKKILYQLIPNYLSYTKLDRYNVKNPDKYFVPKIKSGLQNYRGVFS